MPPFKQDPGSIIENQPKIQEVPFFKNGLTSLEAGSLTFRESPRNPSEIMVEKRDGGNMTIQAVQKAYKLELVRRGNSSEITARIVECAEDDNFITSRALPAQFITADQATRDIVNTSDPNDKHFNVVPYENSILNVSSKFFTDKKEAVEAAAEFQKSTEKVHINTNLGTFSPSEIAVLRRLETLVSSYDIDIQLFCDPYDFDGDGEFMWRDDDVKFSSSLEGTIEVLQGKIGKIQKEIEKGGDWQGEWHQHNIDRFNWDIELLKEGIKILESKKDGA